ncbi:cytochrome bd-I ubiquinol oxidase subunit 2 apoprotein [Antricoccus suffuscus]|uniref:Cytochrome bd-I ubiquinol oxidase subunit 2 apoprotein n=1 Tax=Antricoccus suffuscus TaxID=1629062 RepID=A0A2T1A0C6_9ACTN|nr:cytochrome d ubiquinol oxidase subunit II [Antricoccus suffuscus]PRZ42053.1 cytochrome bd-I ubiquinol oxidase subunit 2 apoprotein [Antricoccus suffuscus]
MTLVDFWFYLIAVLWIGYFFLEGFDFGVGMLLPVLSRSERERRQLINTIGPVWDGNEVWLVVAAGATFAAFPHWYATLFSGFYLPLLVILVGLIVRGVAFEYRGKGPKADSRWKRRWDWCITAGSWFSAVLWGVVFANIVRGVPLDKNYDYVGGLGDLFSPYALLGGAAFASVFLLHGAIFLSLKTSGEVQRRAATFAWRIGALTMALGGGFIAWTQVAYGDRLSLVFFLVDAIALTLALAAVKARRDGWAFVAMGVAIAFMTLAIFVALYPNVMPSTDPQFNLTAVAAASSPYTLHVMTWVAAIMTPVVIAYQGWTYWVFRKRISIKHIPADPDPSAPAPSR